MVEARASSVSDVLDMARVAGNDRKLWLTVGSFIAIGAVLTLLNLKWPITRNAICYAKAALGIVQNHFNVSAIAHNTSWTSGKPILFSIVAAPFVWATDANTGTIIASFIGTAFFLAMAALALERLNRHAGIDSKLAPLEFIFVACNPLVLYQFWSAYPDSLFAGLVILAFVLTDIVATEAERDTRWHIAGLGATIFLAIHTKLYGAVLGLTCPLHLLMHRRELFLRSRFLTAKILTLVAVFAGLALILVATKLNMYTLLEFDDGAGFSDYLAGILRLEGNDIVLSLYMLGFALLLNFNAALLFVPTRAARSALDSAPALFASVYLLGLLTFAGTFNNMRYFLPAFPFIAPVLATGAQSIGSASRSAILISYAIIACTLVGIFNVASIERLAGPVVSKATSGSYEHIAAWLDNLRLPVQMTLKKQTDVINTSVPAGAILYWSSDYYGTASHGLAKDLGVTRSLDIRYVLTPSQIGSPAGSVYMVMYTSYQPDPGLRRVPSWATVQNLGYGVFRLDPISLDVVSEPRSYVEEHAPVRLRGELRTGKLLKVDPGNMNFFDGEKRLGMSSAQPFELDWKDASLGRHEITARTSYGQENPLVSPPLVVYVGIPAVERSVRPTGDLAIELRNGDVQPENYGLEMGEHQSLTGVYFDEVQLLQSAQVAKAYLQLTPAETDSQSTELEIQAELSVNPLPLKFERAELSRRPRTIAIVKWRTGPWTTASMPERSPDLSPILQEVLSQTGWRAGSSLLLLIHGSGKRVAQLPNGVMRDAPRLYVELKRD